MKNMRIRLTTAITIGLLAGSAVGVAAQDETADDESMRPALVTGFLSWPEDSVPVDQLEGYEETTQDGIRREQWVDTPTPPR